MVIPVVQPIRICGGTPVQLGTRTFCRGAVDSNGVEYHATGLDGWQHMPVRLDPIERPFAHGDFDDIGWYGPRMVVLEGRLDCPTEDALELARDDLYELTDSLGSDVLLISRGRQAKVRLAGELLTSRVNPRTLRFSVVLKASDPRKYGTSLRTVTLTTGHTSDVAPNAGRFKEGAPVIATFTGPLPSPVVTAGGLVLGITGNMAAGEVITVDSREDSVLYASGFSAYSRLSAGSSFLQLPPAATTAVSLAVGAGTATGRVDLEWRDTWR
jgi:hypothetical protein